MYFTKKIQCVYVNIFIVRYFRYVNVLNRVYLNWNFCILTVSTFSVVGDLGIGGSSSPTLDTRVLSPVSFLNTLIMLYGGGGGEEEAGGRG